MKHCTAQNAARERKDRTRTHIDKILSSLIDVASHVSNRDSAYKASRQKVLRNLIALDGNGARGWRGGDVRVRGGKHINFVL